MPSASDLDELEIVIVARKTAERSTESDSFRRA
jgi:hypothetical protein